MVGPQEPIEREQIASNWGLQEGSNFHFDLLVPGAFNGDGCFAGSEPRGF
jgi:hypothetical protein